MKFIKRLFTLLLYTFVIFSCKTKPVAVTPTKKEVNYIPYYLKVYEADSLFQIRDYKKSFEILDKLFKKFTPIQTEEYSEYSIYIMSSIMTGNIKNVNENFKKSIVDFGHTSINHRDRDKLYDTLMKVTKITNEDFINFSKDYSQKINLSLRKKIEIMLDEDQAVRVPKYDDEGMKRFQEKHKKEIEEIIVAYGYPNYQVIGYNGYEATNGPIFFLPIFLHQSIDIKEKYLPMLLDSVKKGKLSPNEYAAIFDRAFIEKSNGKQYFGTFPDYTLSNPIEIDSIRKSIGLPKYGYEKWKDKLIRPQYYTE
jgi:hypothetical protein